MDRTSTRRVSLRRLGAVALITLWLSVGATTAGSAADTLPPGPRTIHVSVSPWSEGRFGDEASAISSTGRFVAFLATGPTGGLQAYRRDINTGTTQLVSANRQGHAANTGLHYGSIAISGDGRYVAFVSMATNLVDVGDVELPGPLHVFVRDMASHDLYLANPTAGGHPVELSPYGHTNIALSADGRHLAFTSGTADMDIPAVRGSRQVYRFGLTDRSLTLVSRVPAGGAGSDDSGVTGLAISADGRYVAFDSSATDLLTAKSTSGSHVYVHDVALGRSRLVDVSATGGPSAGAAGPVSLSGDGRYAAFGNVVRDLRAGTNRTIAVPGNGAPDTAADPKLSADGRYVAFAGEYVPYGAEGEVSSLCRPPQVYVRDLQTRSVRRISSAPDGQPLGECGGRWVIDNVELSGDGRFATYSRFSGGEISGHDIYRAGPLR